MEYHRQRIGAAIVLLLLGTATLSAQNAGSILGKAVKGVVKSAADALVGSKEEIEASRRKKPGKDNATPNNNGTKGNNNGTKGNNKTTPKDDDDDKGGGAGVWGGAPTVEIDFEKFYWEETSASYDGIFCVKNNSLGRNYYRFYKVKGGKQVTKTDWRAAQEPHFNKGVCAVMSASTKQWYVLTSSGDSIALDSKITSVTNFLDGVAIASVGYSDHFFINDKGQRVYPNVHPSEAEIYPLRQGNRRLFKAADGYGYLDGHGNVVVKPQYTWASNYSSNYAYVYPSWTDDKYYVIDMTGKKVSEVPNRYLTGGWSFKSLAITDFVNSGAMAHNRETDKYDVVSPQMRVMATFDDATPFCLKTIPGTASVAIVKNDDWKYPEYCNPAGTILSGGNDPITLVPPTKPWYEVANDKDEKTVLMPNIFCTYSHNDIRKNVKDDWIDTRWEFTGYCTVQPSLTQHVGYIMKYDGLIGLIDTRYLNIDAFSADGYAKAIKRSSLGQSQLNLTGSKAEKLEDHMVFIDENQTVLVEIVDVIKHPEKRSGKSEQMKGASGQANSR